MQSGWFEGAVALLQDVLAEEPDQAQAHHELGLVYGFTTRLEESLEELERAAALQPSSRAFRHDLGLTYAMVGEFDKAMTCLDDGDGSGGPSPGAGAPSPLLPITPLHAIGNARPLPSEGDEEVV